ncbi:flavin reductase [Aliiglaciecola lipolytica]|uniref:Flavin reductase domain protein FMN-binding n=1 Tax=Aliiglaciecola lipolytica E3 TaxID=1127673 RepID=K6XQM9_9ALTE|nr:flavin reductase [Aliiglaciecola lipolytica]GAC13996.1 flavin reductase domain protein FMN-binding [Aliiglaciecola lipolytica E3]
MAQQEFDTTAFRNALGSFTTGVTIITATAPDGTPVGLTANSFNSVSLDPPMVLWSLAKTSLSVEAFNEAKHWNVHVLSQEQQDLSNTFASRGENKFAGIDLEEGLSDAPLIPDCSARFQCRNMVTHDGGDHLIYIGEVLNFDQQDLPPLVFQQGQYAMTARKPWEGVELSSEPKAPECSYNEDLLGYLLGRSHFQMLFRMRKVFDEQAHEDSHFFALSVLNIQANLSLEEINDYIEYTGHSLTDTDIEFLISQELIEKLDDETYQLTANGRETSLLHIAQAKAIEEELIRDLGQGDVMALKLLLKRLISKTDPGLPDLWKAKETAK